DVRSRRSEMQPISHAFRSEYSIGSEFFFSSRRRHTRSKRDWSSDVCLRFFVANVSHELKTPLTSIAGYAETLALEAMPGTQTERFTRPVLSNARRMHRLVDDLLDLSRIESGRGRKSDVLGKCVWGGAGWHGC